MNSSLSRFAFIDAVHTAELLHLTQDAVLDLVASGKLRTFGGKPSNPFLRSADVAALIEELGVEAGEPPRRTKSASAKVQARLTADARWSDVSSEEIRDWVQRADEPRRRAAQTTATTAIARLETVLRELEGLG